MTMQQGGLENRLQNQGKTRKELLDEKVTVDAQIGNLKATLRGVKARARKTGRYLPPDQFERWYKTLGNLQARSQEIQRLVGAMEKPRRPTAAFPQLFVEVAEAELPPELFERLRFKVFEKMDATPTPANGEA